MAREDIGTGECPALFSIFIVIKISTTAFVTVVPRLWNDCDNRLGTVVTIVMEQMDIQKRLFICFMNYSMPSFSCSFETYSFNGHIDGRFIHAPFPLDSQTLSLSLW